MNALDVTARGLAKRALDAEAETNEGAVSIAARGEPTAAALEALSAGYAALMGVAGASHTVETAPYLTRDRLVIRGNGAELRNINATPLSTGDVPQAALPIGTSNVWATDALTYYPILSNSGTVLTVASGDGDNFAVGDLVVVHGATKFYVASGEYNVYRNYTRARVVAATASAITLDRLLPAELLADSPVIANAGEGIWAGFDGPSQYDMLYAPHVSNLTLASDLGETLKWGGVIDGTFRDLTMIGRNGVALNALQDCLFENIHVHAWRKVCELAEGSYRTTVRNLWASLADATAKFGGGDDTSGFFISIGENSAECVLEGLSVDSGSNNATSGKACILGSGRDNEIRNSVLRFPSHTGDGLSIQNNATAGSASVDCGYRNVTLRLPVGQRFFNVSDAGGGLTRPYLVDCRCFGTVTDYAGRISGSQGRLDNVWCEDGALFFSGTVTNWTIKNCYFPDGFSNLTRSLLLTNRILDNESDSSRRIAGAAIVNTLQATITGTVANTVIHTMAIQPGDLRALDEVHFRLAGTTGGGGTNTRHVRVTCQIDGATEVEIAHMTTTGNGDAWSVEGTIEIQNTTVVHAAVKQFVNSAQTYRDTRPSGGDLDAYGFTLRVQVWTDVSGSVATQLVKIAGQKAGMRNVPVFG